VAPPTSLRAAADPPCLPLPARRYPYNLAFDYGALEGLNRYSINNLGDPFIESNYGVHSREFEVRARASILGAPQQARTVRRLLSGRQHRAGTRWQGATAGQPGVPAVAGAPSRMPMQQRGQR
jgi:hypothetical protein